MKYLRVRKLSPSPQLGWLFFMVCTELWRLECTRNNQGSCAPWAHMYLYITAQNLASGQRQQVWLLSLLAFYKGKEHPWCNRHACFVKIRQIQSDLVSVLLVPKAPQEGQKGLLRGVTCNHPTSGVGATALLGKRPDAGVQGASCVKRGPDNENIH